MKNLFKLTWLKNTKGKPDAMLTFAFFAFVVVTLNIMLSSISMLTFGMYTVSFQALDSSVMAVYLGATFTAYVSRRWTDARSDEYVSHKETASVEQRELISRKILTFF